MDSMDGGERIGVVCMSIICLTGFFHIGHMLYLHMPFGLQIICVGIATICSFLYLVVLAWKASIPR